MQPDYSLTFPEMQHVKRRRLLFGLDLLARADHHSEMPPPSQRPHRELWGRAHICGSDCTWDRSQQLTSWPIFHGPVPKELHTEIHIIYFLLFLLYIPVWEIYT